MMRSISDSKLCGVYCLRQDSLHRPAEKRKRESDFILQIREWFEQVIANDRASTEKINRGFLEGKTEDIQQELTMFLGETISILDTRARNEEKEIFYHGILLGILKNNSGWAVKSNRESGFGRYDIMLEPKDKNENSFVMEFKVYKDAKEKTIEDTIENAKKQIEERKYAEDLEERGYTKITKMVFAFKGKEVKMQVI